VSIKIKDWVKIELMLDMVKNNLNFLFSKYLQIIGLELKLKKKTSLYILQKKPCMWTRGGGGMGQRNRRRDDN